MECTGLPPDDAFLLLRRHGWDTAAFQESFFDNPEARPCGDLVALQEEPWLLVSEPGKIGTGLIF